ncbi:hypothetical protein EYF80_067533 [Liparis tanakae]|uniref:Uncharacterized protein n=1 Tax=Liparis tanakae TaxID=230148 RepID=A0A4Z2E0Q3_9TELE|nr:hypothetical protein EYF80_067533 [Liparis tanakae]
MAHGHGAEEERRRRGGEEERRRGAEERRRRRGGGAPYLNRGESLIHSSKSTVMLPVSRAHRRWREVFEPEDRDVPSRAAACRPSPGGTVTPNVSSDYRTSQARGGAADTGTGEAARPLVAAGGTTDYTSTGPRRRREPGCDRNRATGGAVTCHNNNNNITITTTSNAQ